MSAVENGTKPHGSIAENSSNMVDVNTEEKHVPNLVVGHNHEAAQQLAAMSREEWKAAEKALLWKM